MKKIIDGAASLWRRHRPDGTYMPHPVTQRRARRCWTRTWTKFRVTLYLAKQPLSAGSLDPGYQIGLRLNVPILRRLPLGGLRCDYLANVPRCYGYTLSVPLCHAHVPRGRLPRHKAYPWGGPPSKDVFIVTPKLDVVALQGCR